MKSLLTFLFACMLSVAQPVTSYITTFTSHVYSKGTVTLTTGSKVATAGEGALFSPSLNGYWLVVGTQTIQVTVVDATTLTLGQPWTDPSTVAPATLVYAKAVGGTIHNLQTADVWINCTAQVSPNVQLGEMMQWPGMFWTVSKANFTIMIFSTKDLVPYRCIIRRLP